MRSLRFCFDFISPYAYLAWTQIHAIAKRHDVRVEPTPILFAALLNAHGTRGPAEVPARRRYLVHDIMRLARHFAVPLVPPPAHPFNPLRALRIASVDPDTIDAFFTATWATGAGIDTVLAGREVTDAGKAKLRASTDAAIAEGMFGVPTMLIDDQMFWGCDSLPHLERYLVTGETADPAMLARWDTLPASASRQA